jgi:hypothetical protein
MTLDEMKKVFPSEWLLIIEPNSNEKHELIKGIVGFHSKDRDETYRYAIANKPKRFATLYTGKLPKNSAVIL